MDGQKYGHKLKYESRVSLKTPETAKSEILPISMAEAVENASIIMPFLCRDYERSKNCEKELSYADTKNKSIIPILIEPNYKPSGWLALVISRFKYIDVSHTGGKALSMCKQLL